MQPQLRNRIEVSRIGRFALVPDRVIFIDQGRNNTKTARPRDSSQRGARRLGAIPRGHWQTTTFVAGLRLGRLDTAMLGDGPMDGAAFVNYAAQVLAPRSRPATSW